MMALKTLSWHLAHLVSKWWADFGCQDPLILAAVIPQTFARCEGGDSGMHQVNWTLGTMSNALQWCPEAITQPEARGEDKVPSRGGTWGQGPARQRGLGAFFF